MISHNLEHESFNQGEPFIHQLNRHVLILFSKIQIQPIDLQPGDKSTKCHISLHRRESISSLIAIFNIQ